MNTTELFSLPERRLQHIVRLLLSDTDTIRNTTTGKPLQIISPGEWNAVGGPDFRNMAVLVDGAVTIGDGEFHRRSSEWASHRHDRDPAYDNLLLHIVLEDNAGCALAQHTLVIDAEELLALLSAVPEPAGDTGGMPSEDLQEYAYRRLLRKTAEALDLRRSSNTTAVFVLLAQRYLGKRRSRQRPKGKAALQMIDDRTLANSEPAQLLELLERGGGGSLYQTMADMVKTTWTVVGAATRMELLVNAFLPAALAIAPGAVRNELLSWYWSQRTVQRYGALARRYPTVGQEYIWKQQGLLEYAALHRFGPDRVAEVDHKREEQLLEAGRRVGVSKVRIVLKLGGGRPGENPVDAKLP